MYTNGPDTDNNKMRPKTLTAYSAWGVVLICAALLCFVLSNGVELGTDAHRNVGIFGWFCLIAGIGAFWLRYEINRAHENNR